MTKLTKSICALSASALLFTAAGCSSAQKKECPMPIAKEPITYTVEKGDTLYKISRKFDITVSDLTEANKITNPDVITEGTILTIPE